MSFISYVITIFIYVSVVMQFAFANPAPAPILTLDNHPLDVVCSIELHGVTIDERLSWTQHVRGIVRTASYRLYMLRRLESLGGPLPELQIYQQGRQHEAGRKSDRQHLLFSMTSVLCRRRGGLLYLTCSCLLLAFCFFTSVLKPSGLRQSRSLEVYPWQMIDYDDYDCGCPRSGPPIVRESEQSMCSDWSTSRGLGQKVVSYSLFGNINKTIIYNKYFSAFEDRLKEVEKYYKGWTARLYHNLSRSDVTSQKYLCRLYCQYPHLDLCQVDNLFPPKGQNADNSGHSNDSSATLSEAPKLPGTIGAIAMARLKAAASFGIHESYEKRLVGRMWRFITMADPLVSEFLVRDVDSSVLPREVAAVQQWLHNSTALLHVMRDHPSHNGVILAGMWGGSRDRGGDFLKELLAKMVRWPPRNIWDYDQMLLKRVVWPEVLDDVLVHDSYFCANPNFRSHHRAAPFPTRRHERYFVGWGPLRDHELAGITPCPLECRPPMHQDWTYC